MSHSPDKRSAPGRRDWAPWLAGWAVFAAILTTILVLRADSSSDFRDFWRTAATYLETGEIRSDLGVHNYLPAFVLLMTPLALLPLPAAAVVFSAASFALFALALWRLDRLFAPPGTRGPSGATRAAVLLAAPYIASGGVLGTVGLCLVALILLAFTQPRGRDSLVAGAYVGIAAVMKILPAALLLMAAVQARWRLVLGGVAAIAVAGGLLPLACLGPAEFVTQHAAYVERAVSGHSAHTTIFAEKPPKANYSNNALPMVLRRLLSPLDARKGDEDPPILVNALSLPAPAIFTSYAAAAALVATGTLLATHRWRCARRRRSDAPDGDALVLGAWCGVMLLASPLLWTHYLVLAIPALWALARRASAPRSVMPRAALLGWALGALLLASPHARAAGAQIFSVLLVWAACVVESLRLSRLAPPPVTQRAGDS